MLDEHNVLVKSFRMVRDTIHENVSSDLKLRLIGRREQDGRRYNLPSVSEVAALIIGDFETSPADRDIIVETKIGKLKQISGLNASYLGLQYPLLFPYGEDGYREDVPLSYSSMTPSTRRKKITMRDFFFFFCTDYRKGNPSLQLFYLQEDCYSNF